MDIFGNSEYERGWEVFGLWGIWIPLPLRGRGISCSWRCQCCHSLRIFATRGLEQSLAICGPEHFTYRGVYSQYMLEWPKRWYEKHCACLLDL